MLVMLHARLAVGLGWDWYLEKGVGEERLEKLLGKFYCLRQCSSKRG